MKRDLELEATIIAKFVAVESVLDERSRRFMGGGGIARDRIRRRCGCLSGDRPGANDYPIGSARNRVGGRAWAPDAPTRRGTPKYRKLSAGGESGVGEAGRSAHPWGPVLTVTMDVQESSETHWRSGQGGLAGEFDAGRFYCSFGGSGKRRCLTWGLAISFSMWQCAGHGNASRHGMAPLICARSRCVRPGALRNTGAGTG